MLKIESEVIILKKVYLNPLTIYDFLYEKIYNCDDLDLIGNDKKAYSTINNLIKIKKIAVSKEEYDPNNIKINKADIYLDDSDLFVGMYFVSNTGFDISKEVEKIKDCLKDDVFEFDLASEKLFKPWNHFLVIPALEPKHQYDIIVFRDLLVSALNNYKPIHLENGKLISNSKNFDIHNFVLGNLGFTVTYFIMRRTIDMIMHMIRLDFLSTKFKGDLYLLHFVAYFKYLQKVHGWNIAETKKFLLRFSIDVMNPSILIDAVCKDINNNDKKLIKATEEVLNIDDEIKKSYIDYSMLLYDIACNIINSKDNNFQNFKLVK